MHVKYFYCHFRYIFIKEYLYRDYDGCEELDPKIEDGSMNIKRYFALISCRRLFSQRIQSKMKGRSGTAPSPFVCVPVTDASNEAKRCRAGGYG